MTQGETLPHAEPQGQGPAEAGSPLWADACAELRQSCRHLVYAFISKAPRDARDPVFAALLAWFVAQAVPGPLLVRVSVAPD